MVGDAIIGSGNTVYNNNLVSNLQNSLIKHSTVYSDGLNGTDIVSWDNGKVGNYWSDYNGSGAYVIDENNVDYHPLMQQVDISTSAPTSTPIQPKVTTTDRSYYCSSFDYCCWLVGLPQKTFSQETLT